MQTLSVYEKELRFRIDNSKVPGRTSFKGKSWSNLHFAAAWIGFEAKLEAEKSVDAVTDTGR